ncbi:TITAN-like protein isoform X3 [Olea europaea var. sylvestris]|uniref:TITAN-like protein isoform X3 n=1 Tax=Olea europaea var. sylvestris TaxID=158386 RepID=UPI000C1D0AB6|nr:TITAN-like protein isoform X3 [Olea europaea var. sylvestris]
MADQFQKKRPNPNNNKNAKKKNSEQHEFEFCQVCKLNHNKGRRHIYFPSHKNSLSSLLMRFQSKLSDVKFFVKTPIILRPEHADRSCLWCIFCDCDILELDSTFACGNAIRHLASEEHWKRVKGFMWKHGGEKDRVDSFRISEADFAKWEKKCNGLKTESANAESRGTLIGPMNDIHNELNFDSVNSFDKTDIQYFDFNTSKSVVPLQSYTNERSQISYSDLSRVSEAGPPLQNMLGGTQVGDARVLKNSAGYVGYQHSCNTLVGACSSSGYVINGSQVCPGERTANGVSSSQVLQNLTQITSLPREATEGNVHTGAPPPWFDATEGNQRDVRLKPEFSNFVSHSGKSSKLNPKRVGAAWAERRKKELELEKKGELVTNNFDANWLPNFGRVWQLGTRKESRKEFHKENKSSIEVESKSEKPISLQPYISKRMRRDASE